MYELVCEMHFLEDTPYIYLSLWLGFIRYQHLHCGHFDRTKALRRKIKY
jgi:hypothetical protein